MKLGTKIALGFTSLVAIAVLLGGMAVWKMNSVAGDSTILAGEYVPEVKVAVDLRGAANRTMYEMRGYGLSEEHDYYVKAQSEMEAVKKHLGDAAALAEKAVHLTALKGQVSEAQNAADTYAELMAQTEQAVAALNVERKKLDENAAAYMKNCVDFLDGQNKNFRTDLEERQKKVKLVTNIVDLGTRARVTNFRAQSNKDMVLMQEAVDLLDDLDKYTGELRPVTRDPANIRQIDDVEEAADVYAANMKAYIKTNEAMADAGNRMDSAAAAYMKNCTDFLASQNEAMQREFKSQGADLEERLQKITLVNDIISVGNEARIKNFKAQATQDVRLMRDAMDTVKRVKTITADLRRITRQQVNISQINLTESAADDYLAAITDYLDNYLKLDEIRAAMDKSAGTYVAQCDAFLQSQHKALTKDMHERHDKITYVNDIVNLGNDSRVKAFKSQALRSPAIMEDAIANFPKLDQKYGDLREITRLEADLKRIDNTKTAGERYAAGLKAFLERWKTLQELGRERGKAGAAVIAACRTTADAGIQNTDVIANDAAAALSSSVTIMIVGLAVAVIVGALLAFFITSGITKPINRIIASLNEGADQVNDAAGQVSMASQQLAEGAGEQASSLEETSSALEEMSAMTKTNADNAKEANQLASTAKTNADKGDETMHQLNDAMSAINESSGQISKIIKVIEEIAFQTNLLALNAAVEAARAGEHGKGFAVVAEEVRNLAQRSAEAARDTTNLIEGSVSRAKEGTEVADSAGQALQDIVGGVSKVADLLNGITRASQEQAQGVEQINTAVSEMDKITQQNAAGAEESASAAEQLSAQAATLKSVVDELNTLVSGNSSMNAGSGLHALRHAQKTPRLTGSKRPAVKKESRTPENTYEDSVMDEF